MRLCFVFVSCCLLLAGFCVPAAAQLAATPMVPSAAPSVLPAAVPMAAPADPYTVMGVVIDMPVASAQEARDTALLAAERQALQKLREQLAASGSTAAIAEPSDTQLARMVQNFEVANERISAKRYSGSFTIRFRPHAVAQTASAETMPAAQAAMPTSNLVALYRFTSLPQWTAMQQRLLRTNAVRSIDLQAIGRGYVRAALNYTGPADALNNALGAQGLHLQQDTNGWVLTGSEGL